MDHRTSTVKQLSDKSKKSYLQVPRHFRIKWYVPRSVLWDGQQRRILRPGPSDAHTQVYFRPRQRKSHKRHEWRIPECLGTLRFIQSIGQESSSRGVHDGTAKSRPTWNPGSRGVSGYCRMNVATRCRLTPLRGPRKDPGSQKCPRRKNQSWTRFLNPSAEQGTGSAQNRCWPKTRITSQSSPLIPSLKDTAMQLLTSVPTGKGSVMIRRSPLAKRVRKPTNLRVFSMVPRKSFESDNIYSHGTDDSQSNVNLCTHWVEVSSESSFFTIVLVK